jgi:hypothetical protein
MMLFVSMDITDGKERQISARSVYIKNKMMRRISLDLAVADARSICSVEESGGKRILFLLL